jgi:hypothetical protein
MLSAMVFHRLQETIKMSLWVYYDDLDFGYSIIVSEDGKTVNITFRGFEEYCTDRILVESLRALADKIVEDADVREFDEA